MNDAAPVNLVFATDSKYAIGVLGNLLALQKFGNPLRVYHIYVLCEQPLGEHSATATRILADSTRIRVFWIPVQESGLKKHGTQGFNFSHDASFYRLLIEKYLPAHLERVLYVDTDCLLRIDPAIVHDWPLDGKPIGAVREHLWRFRWHPDGFDLVPPDAAATDPKYFSSGVLLIDFQQWRARYGPLIHEFIAKNRREICCADQTMLNLVFVNNWKELPGNLNQQLGLRFDLVSLLPGWKGILHFTGGFKQWDPLCHIPQRRIWKQLIRGTALDREEKLPFARRLRVLARTLLYLLKALNYKSRVRSLIRANEARFESLAVNKRSATGI